MRTKERRGECHLWEVTAIRCAVYRTWLSLQPQMLGKNKLPNTASCQRKLSSMLKANRAELQIQKSPYISKHLNNSTTHSDKKIPLIACASRNFSAAGLLRALFVHQHLPAAFQSAVRPDRSKTYEISINRITSNRCL